MDKNAN